MGLLLLLKKRNIYMQFLYSSPPRLSQQVDFGSLKICKTAESKILSPASLCLINAMFMKGLNNNTDLELSMQYSNLRIKFQDVMTILHSQSLMQNKDRGNF